MCFFVFVLSHNAYFFLLEKRRGEKRGRERGDGFVVVVGLFVFGFENFCFFFFFEKLSYFYC